MGAHSCRLCPLGLLLWAGSTVSGSWLKEVLEQTCLPPSWEAERQTGAGSQSSLKGHTLSILTSFQLGPILFRFHCYSVAWQAGD